jgi:hypothetical protein
MRPRTFAGLLTGVVLGLCVLSLNANVLFGDKSEPGSDDVETEGVHDWSHRRARHPQARTPHIAREVRAPRQPARCVMSARKRPGRGQARFNPPFRS